MKGFISVRDVLHIHKKGEDDKCLMRTLYHHVGSPKILVRYQKLYREVTVVGDKYYLYL